MMSLSDLVRHALAEDIGPGDVTTEAVIPIQQHGRGQIVAKEVVVAAGHEVAAEVFAQQGARYLPLVESGHVVGPGTSLAQVEGPVRGLLRAERVALNFLMRLSGIATQTRSIVAAAPSLRVVDTRKTTPLLRKLERTAVRTGGGHNHRYALYDGILIKENHIRAAGSLTRAVERARANAHHLLRIEVETTTLAEVDEAVVAQADVIMLDNMDDATMAKAIEKHRGRVVFEASGNVTAERLPGLAALGLDVVSMGGLIHQARWVDLSMKLEDGSRD